MKGLRALRLTPDRPCLCQPAHLTPTLCPSLLPFLTTLLYRRHLFQGVTGKMNKWENICMTLFPQQRMGFWSSDMNNPDLMIGNREKPWFWDGRWSRQPSGCLWIQKLPKALVGGTGKHVIHQEALISGPNIRTFYIPNSKLSLLGLKIQMSKILKW